MVNASDLALFQRNSIGGGGRKGLSPKEEEEGRKEKRKGLSDTGEGGSEMKCRLP